MHKQWSPPAAPVCKPTELLGSGTESLLQEESRELTVTPRNDRAHPEATQLPSAPRPHRSGTQATGDTGQHGVLHLAALTT